MHGVLSITALVASVAAVACWRGPIAPEPDPMKPPDDARDAARKPRCRKLPGEKLASFYNVELHGTYWIDMYDDGAGWEPIEHVPMPHHHATRLELTNVADFEPRFRPGTRRARFLIEVRSREVRPATAGRPWFTTYHAHILEMCVLRSRI